MWFSKFRIFFLVHICWLNCAVKIILERKLFNQLMKCQNLFIEHLLVELRSLTTARAVLALQRGDCGGFHERERTNSPHCSILKTPGGGGIHLRNTSQIFKTIKSGEIIIAFFKKICFPISSTHPDFTKSHCNPCLVYKDIVTQLSTHLLWRNSTFLGSMWTS